MNACRSIKDRFSNYLDGALSGVEMQRIAAHLEACQDCAVEFSQWRSMQDALCNLAPAKAPADLALRLRIAVSKERTRTPRNLLALARVRWENSVQPYLLQASAGFASAVLLMGTMALLIGTFAVPEPAAARDEPAGAASTPHFLYSDAEASSDQLSRGDAVVVEAYVNGHGEVYDYRIVSGPRDAQTRAALDNLLLFSVFQPAMLFGQPVRGVALLSFSSVAVRG
jgi:anti-sigma factor RsiW